MFVNKLKLYQFRNLKDQEINFSNRLNLIHGDNGEGKTNLLESLYILSLTKSFRLAKSQDFICLGKEESSIFADIEDSISSKNIGISFYKNQNKKIFVNHIEEKSVGNFIKNLVCICFNPIDILMIKSGAEDRRKFLDKHVSDYNASYLVNLLQYKKALKNKNILLKSAVSKEKILPWNKIMADNAFIIQKERVKFLKELEIESKKIYSQIAPKDGELNLGLKNNFLGIETKEELFSRYNNYINQELMFKKSMVGIHKDDLLIFLGNKESRKYASQGQARSIVLALKLGVIKVLESKLGESPVVLLDDVDSELDDTRREMLFSMIFNQKTQVFISAVNNHILSFCGNYSERVKTFTIKHGMILEKEMGK